MLTIKTVLETPSDKRRKIQVSLEDQQSIVFPIEYYSLLAKMRKPNTDDAEEDGVYLYDVNRFLMTLGKDDSRLLYEMYNDIHACRAQSSMDDYKFIRDRIYFTLMHCGIYTALVKFASGELFTYPDLTDAGQRDGNSENNTFCKNEFVELTALALLSKLLVPIFGLYFELDEIAKVPSVSKEGLLLDLLDPYLTDSEFSAVYEKLEFYVQNRLSKDIGRRNRNRKTDFDYLKSLATEMSISSLSELTYCAVSKTIINAFYKYDGVVFAEDATIPNILIYTNSRVTDFEATIFKKLIGTR